MLSTNSSVSAPVESRKYSAIVNAERATRRRDPGGSFIWPKTMQVCSITLRPVSPICVSCISSHRSVPSRVRSPDAGEHRVAAVAAGDTSDQLGQNHRLAETGTAEQSRLTTANKRRQQVDNLDPGLKTPCWSTVR